jgi:hypothetical protein
MFCHATNVSVIERRDEIGNKKMTMNITLPATKINVLSRKAECTPRVRQASTAVKMMITA